jgi:hypothetical protein
MPTVFGWTFVRTARAAPSVRTRAYFLAMPRLRAQRICWLAYCDARTELIAATHAKTSYVYATRYVAFSNEMQPSTFRNIIISIARKRAMLLSRETNPSFCETLKVVGMPLACSPGQSAKDPLSTTRLKFQLGYRAAVTRTKYVHPLRVSRIGSRI